MWDAVRARKPGSTLPRLVIYEIARFVVAFVLILIYRARAYDARRVPAVGPVLLAANHQSYLDPPLIGAFVATRQLSYLARAGLFSFRVFGWLISLFNSLPIREDGGDAAAIKETLRRLERGEAMLIFPEGTRSPDGSMATFKRGVALLVRKSRCPVVPVAVEGCFDAFPRGRLPRLLGHRVAVAYGHPIAYDELMQDGPDAALDRLAREIDALRLMLRRRLREQTAGALPIFGPGDEPSATPSRRPAPRQNASALPRAETRSQPQTQTQPHPGGGADEGSGPSGASAVQA
jgi:1-acyl-sn-glycerol-3-phosphate acyltransferase